jgi:hypothetical protein
VCTVAGTTVVQDTYEEYYPLGCNAMQSSRSLAMFWSNIVTAVYLLLDLEYGGCTFLQNVYQTAQCQTSEDSTERPHHENFRSQNMFQIEIRDMKVSVLSLLAFQF